MLIWVNIRHTFMVWHSAAWHDNRLAVFVKCDAINTFAWKSKIDMTLERIENEEHVSVIL